MEGGYDLHTPSFFVARDRGKALPRLHKARVEAIRVDAHKRFWNSDLP